MKKAILFLVLSISFLSVKAQTPFYPYSNFFWSSGFPNSDQAQCTWQSIDNYGNNTYRSIFGTDTMGALWFEALKSYNPSVNTNTAVLGVNPSTGQVNRMDLSVLKGFSLGSATFSGVALQTQYTITHGLGFTPTLIVTQPTSPNAAALSYVDNITSTTFRITFLTIPVLGTNNIVIKYVGYR